MNDSSPSPLTASQSATLEAALRTRQRDLRADVASHLRTQDDPRLVGLRNRMEETDDYGECADCGNPIPYARLVAYPAAKRCVACQERTERLENARK